MTETHRSSGTASSSIWSPFAQQRVFRKLMNAFAYPGRIGTLSISPDKALTGVLACLLDSGTTLADSHKLVSEHDRRLLSASCADPETASFIVASGEHAPAFTPRLGTLESPEHGATIILKVEELGAGLPLILSGPGVPGSIQLYVRGLDSAWAWSRAKWVMEFPLGVDFILVDDDDHVAAIPRSSKILLERAI